MLSEKDDQLQSAKENREKAFERLFHLYFEKLFFFARDYVINPEVSRELVQDTFARLWEIKDSLGPDTNIQSLLYTITRNNALNYLKHETVKEKYIRNTNHLNSIELNYIALNDLAFQKLYNDDFRKQVNDIVKSLPEKCRTAFKMSRNLELSYKEIAIRMGISVKTVENHIAEALKRIREGLKDLL